MQKAVPCHDVIMFSNSISHENMTTSTLEPSGNIVHDGCSPRATRQTDVHLICCHRQCHDSHELHDHCAGLSETYIPVYSERYTVDKHRYYHNIPTIDILQLTRSGEMWGVFCGNDIKVWSICFLCYFCGIFLSNNIHIGLLCPDFLISQACSLTERYVH